MLVSNLISGVPLSTSDIVDSEVSEYYYTDISYFTEACDTGVYWYRIGIQWAMVSNGGLNQRMIFDYNKNYV